MSKRALTVTVGLLAVFALSAIVRFVLNVPADRRGYDAIDYVTLHGNVQHEDLNGRPLRPVDVTGVYIHEGSATQTMIELLRYFPHLEFITIGPDHTGLPIGTPAEQLPRLTPTSNGDLQRIRDAFPSLEVQLARPTFQADAQGSQDNVLPTTC